MFFLAATLVGWIGGDFVWNSNFYRSWRLRDPFCISVPNFEKICQTVAEISRFLWFWRWRLPPSWIFKNSKFLQLICYRGPTCVLMPNFIKIGQTVGEIWRFNGFYRAMLCICGTSHGPVCVSMSVSVCLSVTSRSSTKMVKRRIT